MTGLFGAQCVFIPARHIPLALGGVGRVRKAFDAALQEAITGHRLPAYVITPHAVQHRHDRTCRAPESYPKRSLSFGVPRGHNAPMLVKLRLGCYFDAGGHLRPCVVVVQGGIVVAALDAETRERVDGAEVMHFGDE